VSVDDKSGDSVGEVGQRISTRRVTSSLSSRL
jgi:hypothetical protein